MQNKHIRRLQVTENAPISYTMEVKHEGANHSDFNNAGVNISIGSVTLMTMVGNLPG
jgi:hypothetical protein